MAELPVDATTQAQQAAHHAKRTDEMTRGVILTIQPVDIEAWARRQLEADEAVAQVFVWRRDLSHRMKGLAPVSSAGEARACFVLDVVHLQRVT